MLRKALIVYAKEMLTMRRDRRLTIGVTVISLVVMPALMGFVGRMTSEMDRGTEATAVMNLSNNPLVEAVLIRDGNLFTIQPLDGMSFPERVTIVSRDTVVLVQTDRSNPRLWDAARRIEIGLYNEKQRMITARLEQLGVVDEMPDPVSVRLVDTSSAHSRGAALLGALVPYLVIVLLVANSVRAVYVAVGEKENNTLASLLVCQVPREAIVMGKILAITTFAIFASILLIVGLILFASFGFTIAGDTLGPVTFRLTAMQIVQLVVNIGGLSLVISSVIMVVGTYARTQREAGVYTAPLLFISIFLALFSFSDVAFPITVYMVPILGNAVVMKTTIIDGLDLPALGITLVMNALVFALLVGVSVTMYHRESVLFRR